ncbi:protein kinase subdomain-containing protein PKL/CAK/Fmp29 [Armillaria mellea]|nr:protein kinase subdomain-containing protein PKL/CAK/Fmp29 [Armillaria mellea]
MSCFASARLVFFGGLAAPVSLSLRRPRSSLHSLNSSFSTSTPPPRPIFNLNDTLRHEERRRVFNVNGLSRLAAESVGRSPDDIVGFEKLAEGGFNHIFLITMRDDFQLVAPKSDFLHSSGLPIPNIYGYSPTLDNVAETEYIFMEFVNSMKLSDIWFDLEERQIVSVVRQLVQLEAKMMSACFPAGGSLYYAQDLERVAGRPGIPLEDERFCIGLDVRLPLWYRRRSQLDVDRGPYESIESALVRAASKELAYLQQLGQPLLPFRCMRRESYRYQEQSPSDHIDNLQCYLLIAPSLVPKDPSLSHFRVRRADLQETNIVVSRSSDSDLQVVSGLDWQHASILPTFLLASIPQRLQNYNDRNFDDLDEAAQSYAKELHRRHLVHYHYLNSTEECNEVHHVALADPMGVLRRHLFQHAGDPWEGETIALKVDLIEATKSWEMLAEGGAPCPVVFDAADVHETMKLDAALRAADASLEMGRNIVGFGSEGWVPKDHYERVMARSKKLKEDTFAETKSAERAEVDAHWPLDDMDEEKYM